MSTSKGLQYAQKAPPIPGAKHIFTDSLKKGIFPSDHSLTVGLFGHFLDTFQFFASKNHPKRRHFDVLSKRACHGKYMTWEFDGLVTPAG
jgi:hypothetical protein